MVQKSQTTTSDVSQTLLNNGIFYQNHWWHWLARFHQPYGIPHHTSYLLCFGCQGRFRRHEEEARPWGWNLASIKEIWYPQPTKTNGGRFENHRRLNRKVPVISCLHKQLIHFGFDYFFMANVGVDTWSQTSISITQFKTYITNGLGLGGRNFISISNLNCGIVEKKWLHWLTLTKKQYSGWNDTSLESVRTLLVRCVWNDTSSFKGLKIWIRNR